jgi:hypothetical protein
VDKPKEQPKATEPDGNEIRALSDRAQAGDRAAMAPLRRLLEQPEWVEALGGNLAQQTRLWLVEKFAGKNLLLKESVRRKMDLMAAELAGPSPSALERLLVERVVACWLHLHFLEAAYINRDGLTIAQGAYHQRVISAAHKRYLSAIKALAVVRKLALPVLQVNIARKQVNVGACATPPDG